MSGIIPPDHDTPPQDAPGAGTGKRHVPDARRATGDARLGAMLREMRRDDGRGLKEAAHACGVSYSSMHAYETGGGVRAGELDLGPPKLKPASAGEAGARRPRA